VFSGAPPLAHEVRIGLKPGIHSLERILVKMSGQQTPSHYGLTTDWRIGA
jgi:hypothetical protein